MTELLQWWNLLFVLPFVGALLYILLLCSGAVAAEHDIGFSVDGESDFDADHDAGVEHIHDLQPGLLSSLLQLLGIGKVPLSIIVISFCCIWGFIGFTGNTVLKTLLPPSLFVWLSLIIAFVVATALTRSLARLIARFMPVTETYAISPAQLVGKWAETTTRIDDTFGQAIVHDDAGVLHTVQCIIKTGEEPIPIGSRVLLVLFDKNRGVFHVSM